MHLNPFCPLFFPFSAAKVLALKATVIVLLTLLIKAKVRIEPPDDTTAEEELLVLQVA